MKYLLEGVQHYSQKCQEALGMTWKGIIQTVVGDGGCWVSKEVDRDQVNVKEKIFK